MEEKTKKRVAELDKYLRDKAGMKASDFITEYCKVFRPYAYATQDDSLNEFEKLITHVLGMYMYHIRRSEILGLSTDPRDFVQEYEDAQEEFEAAIRERADGLMASALEAVNR